AKNLASLVVRQVAHDQRDRLRVLVLNERQQVLRLGLLQKRERRLPHLRRNLLHDPVGLFRIEALRQQLLRIIQPPLRRPRLRQRQLIELRKHLVPHRLRHVPQRRQLPRHLLDRLGLQLLENQRRRLLVQPQQQNRRLPHRGKTLKRRGRRYSW